MNTNRKLQVLFGSLVPFAAIGLANKHEAAAAPPATSTTPTFAQSLCTVLPSTPDGRIWRNYEPLQGLKLASPKPDYIALKTSLGPFGPPDRPEFLGRLMSEAGWICAHASNVIDCEGRLAGQSVSGATYSSKDSFFPYYLVTQRADEQRVIATWSEFRTMTGPIDTLAEAALVATLKNYRIECGFSTGEKRGTGFRITAQTGSVCDGQHVDAHVLDITRDGVLSLVSTRLFAPGTGCVSGRTPHGFRSPAERPASSGDYFATATQLEHASIAAFVQIAEFLTKHRAPPALVRRAKLAAKDEELHTSTMHALAERYGAAPSLVDARAEPFAHRLAFALDNAEDGCVRETFAALLAREQAARTNDPTVARALRAIANDETRHAALAWDLAAWIEPMLSTSERAYVASRRSVAFAELRAQWSVPWIEVLEREVGMPPAARALQLIDGLEIGLGLLAA